MENQPSDENELNTLEESSTELDGQEPTTTGTTNEPVSTAVPSPKKQFSLKGGIQGLIGRLNIYLLIFVLIIVLTTGFTIASIQRNKKEDTPVSIETQALTEETLKKLNSSDAKIGDPKQTLLVESNAIFAGKVLIKDSLDVAGTIKVGGALSLPGLTVAGNSTLDQIQGNSLTISGDANIQGQLTAQKGITVTGGGSFGGPISAPQITIQSLQLSGDLQLQRHIDAGGTAPGKTDGPKLGSGGTSSVSGTDTAGTVTINLGGNLPQGDGCFVTINFTQKFNDIPHVVITPIGPGAAGLNYYVNRTNTNFQVCATNASSGSFSFDYIVID